MQTLRHMLGVWDMHCMDKELRQWLLCVTFSASPMTVTHAQRRMPWRSFFVGRGIAAEVNCRRDAAATQVGWASRGGMMGVSARAMSQGPQPLMGCTALPGPKPFGVSATQTGTTMTLVVEG